MIEITLMKGKVLLAFDSIEVTLHVKPGVRTCIVQHRPCDLNITEKNKPMISYYLLRLRLMFNND